MGAMEAFDLALREQLLGDAAITALVGTRIYLERAPQDAETPYIVISWSSWNEITDRTRAPEIDATANVRIVVNVDTDGARRATQGADAIAERLRGAQLDVADGWGVHWCRLRGRHRTPHLIDRADYSSAGVLVQIGAIRA